MDYIDACTHEWWHVETWPKDKPEETQRHPFKCGSWRHEGDCRLFKGAQDFARIKEAIESRGHWLHIVLTYPTWLTSDVRQLYRDGLFHWAKLRKRTQRRFGDYKYIQVWEKTRNDYPHCHMAVSCEGLYKECNSDGILNFWELLRIPAVQCGFGKIGWCKPLRDAGLMAGYLCKLAREMTGSGKAYQIPVNAPRHFRRLRASSHLLPPPRKNPDITGALHFCRCDGELTRKKSD